MWMHGSFYTEVNHAPRKFSFQLLDISGYEFGIESERLALEFRL